MLRCPDMFILPTYALHHTSGLIVCLPFVLQNLQNLQNHFALWLHSTFGLIFRVLRT